MSLQSAGCLRGLLQSHAKLHPITADRRRDARRSKLAHSRSMRFSFQRSDCVGPGNRVSFKEGNAFIGGPTRTAAARVGYARIKNTKNRVIDG